MHTRVKRTILLGLTLLFVGTSAVFHGPIQDMRAEYELTSDPVHGDNPELVLATTALGAFRGIIVDVVWVRLQQLKQQGRFFEIVQLSDWACKLAPQFAKIWEFHAWNMAYNVSVEIPELKERWSWVRSGMELLRDEAIPANPRDPSLYNALARIYLDKIGEQKDDAHMVYKAQLGLEMHEVLDGGGSREKLEQFVKAPDTRQEMLDDQRIKRIYEKCKEHEFNPLDYEDFFRWLNGPESVPEEAAAVLGSPENEEAVGKIETYVRARRLKEEYRLQPTKMLEIMDRYGPFDWRSPYPHAIYWATRAKEKLESFRQYIIERRMEFNVTPDELPRDPRLRPEMQYREIDYDRTIYASMQSLIRYGRLTYNSEGQIMPVFAPDWRFTDSMIDLYEKMLEKYEGTIFARGVNAGYMYFLRRVAIETYLSGDQQGSMKYWERLKQEYPDPRFKKPYSQFINEQLKEYIGDMGRAEAGAMVRGLLIRAYQYYGCNVMDKGQALEAKAKALAQHWNKTAETLRWTVPLEKIRESVLIDIFSDRVRFAPEIMENLKDYLGEEKVKKYRDAAKKLEQQRVRPEDIPERFRRAPTTE